MSTTQASYPISGMTCLSCAESVRKTLAAQPGVASVQVDFNGQRVELGYDKGYTSFDSLKASLLPLGYTLSAGASEGKMQHQEHLNSLKLKTILALATSLPCFILGMVWGHNPVFFWIDFALSLFVLGYCGGFIYKATWQQLRQRELTMDTLVTIGTASAAVYTLLLALDHQRWAPPGGLHAESGAMIMAFILLGKYLEAMARQEAQSATDQLSMLATTTATVLKGGQWQKLPSEMLHPGDVVKVAAGERIAADGVLSTGQSYVDESLLSGEPMPVDKKPGDRLIAGSLNLSHTLEMSVLKAGETTLLAQIIHEVQAAQASKAPLQRLADRLSAVFVPVVLVIALGTFLSWLLLPETPNWPHAVRSALTVLVISCPCALGLATPVAVKIAIARANKLGLLVRNAEALERAHGLDIVAFDKTGTLTEGKPSVVETWQGTAAWETQQERRLQGILSQSSHPLTQAVRQALNLKRAPELPQTFEEIPGQGLKAVWADDTWLLGKASFLEQNGLVLPPDLQAWQSRQQSAGNSLVFLGSRASGALSAWALADTLKPEAQATVTALKAKGIDVWLLSGDHAAAALHMGTQLGIDHLEGGMMPQDKAARIRQWSAEGKKVAFVGDGINDAVALSAAHLGIAMSHGADAAIHSAGVVLLNGRIDRLLHLLALAGRQRRIVAQNLAWAFGYNILALPLATGWLPWQIPPALAALSMGLSSLGVVLNSLRLQTQKSET